MTREHRLKRLRFRANHRGTKEADIMVGGFFDRFSNGWSDDEIGWFEELMHEQDADIMGWAMGSIAVPPRWQGAMIERMQTLDYIHVQR